MRKKEILRKIYFLIIEDHQNLVKVISLNIRMNNMDVFGLKKIVAALLLTLSFDVVFAKTEIVFTKGNSQLKRANNTMPLSKNMVLKHDDTVVTGDRGLVVLKSKASTYKVSRNSRLVLDLNTKEIVNSNLDYGSVVVEFLKDNLSESKGQPLNIKTVSSSFGVRGTKFFSYVDRRNKNSVLSVERGEVAFKGVKATNETLVGGRKSSMTNVKSEQITPRSFGFENEINWNLSSRGGPLSHSDKLFSSLDEAWQEYKNEKAQAWKKRNEDMDSVWEEMNN